MEKVKRNERLAVMTSVFTASPNKIIGLNTFCEMFDVAKSSVSEDIDILEKIMKRFSVGKLETVTGAAGGARFRPVSQNGSRRAQMEKLCETLMQKDRILSGGFLYLSDILSDPETVAMMGETIAEEFYSDGPDAVLTMETMGIPVAMMTARALNVPLVIARHTSKVYEGSAVSVNFVSATGSIETMSLSRRAIPEGSNILVVDDFIRGGGTASGMQALVREFDAVTVGMCFVLSADNGSHKMVRDFKSLMRMMPDENGGYRVIPEDWIR